MFTVESLIRFWKTETDICLALFDKMPAGGLEYRPSPSQRNTLELLKYLSKGPRNGVIRVVAGDWNATPPAMEMAKNMPPSDFPREMRRQADEVERALRGANPEDLVHATMSFPWGETLTKADALIHYPYRWLTGYRMQLFLYLKAAGATQLGTPDLWRAPPSTGSTSSPQASSGTGTQK
jgi:hypothetical protein